MDFKDESNHFAFILFTIIIFFGVATFLLIPNYMSLPKVSEDHNYIYGVDNHKYPFKEDTSDFFVISFNDNKITNIENIIILLVTIFLVILTKP